MINAEIKIDNKKNSTIKEKMKFEQCMNSEIPADKWFQIFRETVLANFNLVINSYMWNGAWPALQRGFPLGAPISSHSYQANG